MLIKLIKKFLEFLQDSQGNLSSSRLIVLSCVPPLIYITAKVAMAKPDSYWILLIIWLSFFSVIIGKMTAENVVKIIRTIKENGKSH